MRPQAMVLHAKLMSLDRLIACEPFDIKTNQTISRLRNQFIHCQLQHALSLCDGDINLLRPSALLLLAGCLCSTDRPFTAKGM